MDFPWEELTKQPKEQLIDIKICVGCLPNSRRNSLCLSTSFFFIVFILKCIDLSLSCFITTLLVSAWQQVGRGRECEWGLERERERERQTLYTWDVFLLMTGAAVPKLPQRSYHHSGGSRVGWASWRGGYLSSLASRAEMIQRSGWRREESLSLDPRGDSSSWAVKLESCGEICVFVVGGIR